MGFSGISFACPGCQFGTFFVKSRTKITGKEAFQWLIQSKDRIYEPSLWSLPERYFSAGQMQMVGQAPPYHFLYETDMAVKEKVSRSEAGCKTGFFEKWMVENYSFFGGLKY
jgi:hypothetical protein